MKPKHKQNRKFLLKGIGTVKPFNGETGKLLPKKYLSWSHGFTHFVKDDGEVGCCGIFWFEENAIEIR